MCWLPLMASLQCYFNCAGHSNDKARETEIKAFHHHKFVEQKTRMGVYETLCPQYMLVPEDNLETRLLYNTNCQSWKSSSGSPYFVHKVALQRKMPKSEKGNNTVKF